METPVTTGTAFAQALAEKAFDRVTDLLDPAIDFRALTPKRDWEASNPGAVISGVLCRWFDDSGTIEALERVESNSFADRERVGYRFRVRSPDGLFLIEQQAYLATQDDRIKWMRVLCSGFRPIATPDRRGHV